jgi:hypothetical protein
VTRTGTGDDEVVVPPTFALAPLAIALALALALRMPADAGRRVLPLTDLRTPPATAGAALRTAVDAASRHRQDGARPVRSRMTPKETAR